MHEQFGRYVLEDRIAIGGMAEIFRAKAPGLGGFEKVLAIKRLHPRYSQDADFIEMLIDEARITVELSHASIGQIFDLGKVDDHYFIAMEFIDGRDLYRVMKKLKERGETFPLDTAAFVAMQCCAGLDYAHRKRDSRARPLHIIHRDVSPQNVLLSFEGEVKLVDFGIAKAALRAYETESGIIKGKFYYMSPEQAKGERLDHRTDIFSLGIVLYEMLTGDLLYKDDDEATLLSRVRKADIQSPRYLRPDIPPALERIVMKALSRDREHRYPTARHMQRDLADWLQDAGGVTSSARLAALMRETYAEAAPAQGPPPALHGPDFADFGADEHSVISEAMWQDGDDQTRADPESLDGSSLADMPAYASDLLELDEDDFELVEIEDKPTVNYAGPAAVPDAFDSIEADGFGIDPFLEEDETRSFGDRPPAALQEAQAMGLSRPEAPIPTPVPVAVRPAVQPALAPRLAAVAPEGRGIRRSGDRHRRVVLRQEPEQAGFTRQPTVIVPRDGTRGTRDGTAGRSAVHRPLARPSRIMESPGLAAHGAPTESWLSRDRLLLGLFLLGIIIAAGVITSLLMDDGPPPPPGPPARTLIGAAPPPVSAPTVAAAPVTAAPATATLSVSSFPSGARVRIDGKWQTHETTPTHYEVPAGRPIELRVQLESYAPFDTRLTLQPGQTETVHARLERLRGSITVESTPSGALVTVDGRDVGRTPLTVNDQPMESAARVRVSKDGFEPFETTVAWGDRRDHTLDARLEPVAATPPVIAEAPPKPVAPKPKPRRRTRVRRPAPPRDPAPIARRPTRREPTGSGLIAVTSRPWGYVYVNGNLVSRETPLNNYQVPVGDHQVRVCFEGDRQRCSPPRRVVVAQGQRVLVKF